jgi:hypothetical protein
MPHSRTAGGPLDRRDAEGLLRHRRSVEHGQRRRGCGVEQTSRHHHWQSCRIGGDGRYLGSPGNEPSMAGMEFGRSRTEPNPHPVARHAAADRGRGTRGQNQTNADCRGGKRKKVCPGVWWHLPT